MTPYCYLFLVLSILLLAVALEGLRQYRRGRVLRGLARQWQMHYAAGDRLRLARRIAGQMPAPGAANVWVQDLIFCIRGDCHQYLFTVEYTLGVVGGKVARRCVAGFDEPVSRGGHLRPAAPVLTVAPPGLALPAQYEFVRHALARPAPVP